MLRYDARSADITTTPRLRPCVKPKPCPILHVQTSHTIPTHEPGQARKKVQSEQVGCELTCGTMGGACIPT
jgi:hypothetical protein